MCVRLIHTSSAEWTIHINAYALAFYWFLPAAALKTGRNATLTTDIGHWAGFVEKRDIKGRFLASFLYVLMLNGGDLDFFSAATETE